MKTFESKTRKACYLHLRMTDEEKDALRVGAGKAGVTLTEFVRMALSRLLDEQAKAERGKP